MKITKTRQKLKPLLAMACMAALIAGLAGCATDQIGTPCPHFGSGCTKTPINSWK